MASKPSLLAQSVPVWSCCSSPCFMAGAPVHHRLQVLELSSELQTTELRWLMGRMADAEVARSESSLTKSQKNNQKKKLRKEKRRRRPAHRPLRRGSAQRVRATTTAADGPPSDGG
ncbi:unnamed protein product [Durusdinium trenchii]|uniref:Uncharacterized protein n=1 Tax=Durusdinium trenchii TaxID=1381693 RepID=A0ABP0LAV6_9DINO